MASELAASMEDDFAMRKVCFVLVVSAVVSLFGESRTAIAEATESEPDFKLAYVLATASYCAYAVGELDDDHGRARAFECLRAAADKNPVHLERLKVVSTDDVEAYFNLQSPKDAYLLIRFRGTLVPPISPSSGRLVKATAEAVKAYKEQAAAALGTFTLDWFNNAQVYGLYEGIFRSVGKAFASDFVPEHLRASGIGWYSTAVGLLQLVASIVAGLLWDRVGHAAAFYYGAVFAVVGSMGLILLIPRKHDCIAQ